MTCIAGRLRFADNDAQQQPVRQMLAAMHARAPDGDELHGTGAITLGHAFLRTGRSGAEGPHRLTLDGNVWIAADARIDDRPRLLDQLRKHGCDVQTQAPHAELILHAYHAFRDDFLHHLIGDFAFALWDAPRERLICARDQFGVRPFHYSHIGGCLTFASTIEALLLMPEVSRTLDETAVADFLLLGTCTEAEQTIYQDIRCLAPATRMDVTRAGISLTKYWELSRGPEIRYRARRDYVSHFLEVFEPCVVDRLPDGPVALQLSGGMDSTTIAAVAADWGKKTGNAVSAHHVSSRSIEPGDDEGHFARLTAAFLGIPMESQDVGGTPLFHRSDDPALRTDSPVAFPQIALHDELMRNVRARGARVLLGGYGGDAVLSPSHGYFASLWREGRIVKFTRELARHVINTGTLRGAGLRELWPHNANETPSWKPPQPDWIASPYAQQLRVDERWHTWWSQHESTSDGFSHLRLPWIHRGFEGYEVLDQPVVARHPFNDLRLIRYLSGLPNFMLVDKHVLREAFRSCLPDDVLARPKTAAAGDYVRKLAADGKLSPSIQGHLFHPPPRVDGPRFQAAWQRFLGGEGADTTWASWLIMHPVALGIWLGQKQEIHRE